MHRQDMLWGQHSNYISWQGTRHRIAQCTMQGKAQLSAQRGAQINAARHCSPHAQLNWHHPCAVLYKFPMPMLKLPLRAVLLPSTLCPGLPCACCHAWDSNGDHVSTSVSELSVYVVYTCRVGLSLLSASLVLLIWPLTSLFGHCPVCATSSVPARPMPPIDAALPACH